MRLEKIDLVREYELPFTGSKRSQRIYNEKNTKFSLLSKYFKSLIICVNIKILLFICSLLAGCSNLPKKSLTTHAAAQQNTLRLHMSSDPTQLDPRRANDQTSGTVLRMIFEGLTRLDSTGKPINALAENIEQIGDKIYLCKLRKAFWSNGDRITSRDFQRSWMTVLDPKFACANSYQLFPIKNAKEIKQGRLPMSQLGVELFGDSTLQIELESPTPYFREILAFDSFYPFHAETKFPMGRGAIPSITCGPFQLKEWRVQNEMVFTKNSQYWDAANVAIDNIHISIFQDERSPLYLFERGELDYVGSPLSNLPNEEIEAVKSSGQLCCMRNSFVYWFNLNTQILPFTNSKVRRAFALSINRHTLACLLDDRLTPAYWFLPPSLSSGNPPLIRDESSRRAKELLAEGLEELGIHQIADFEVKLIYTQNSLHRRIAQILQQQWRQTLGINVQLITTDRHDYNRRLKRRDFHIARYGWQAQVNDPIDFLEIFTSAQVISGYNFSGWENEKYDQLIALIRKTGDLKKRRELVAEAESLLISEMPIIPLFFQSYCYVKSPRLKKVTLTPNGKIDFRWAYFQNSQKLTDKEDF